MDRKSRLLLFILLFVSVYRANSNETNKTKAFIPENIAVTISTQDTATRKLSTKLENQSVCDEIIKQFSHRWFYRSMSISKYLSTLKALNCPQFEDQCKTRTFAFSAFPMLVYDYLCNPDCAVEKCYPTVNAIVNFRGGEASINRSTQCGVFHGKFEPILIEIWLKTAVKLNEQGVTKPQAAEPCVQLALYATRSDDSSFVELHTDPLSFCHEVPWCGLDTTTIGALRTTMWDCISKSCKAKVIALASVCVLLGLITTTVNSLVIIVLFANRRLRHSQGIYRLSLAFADLLVGVVVFPTFAVTIIMETNIPFPEGGSSVNGLYTAQNLEEIKERSLQSHYINSVGFITTLSIATSVYTLAVAGFDRVYATRSPLIYEQHQAKSRAVKYALVVWALCALLSALPLLPTPLEYIVIASFYASPGGAAVLVMYCVIFILPLCITWAANAATFYYTTNSGADPRIRRSSSAPDGKISVDGRLSKTLFLMTSAFTLSMLPAICLLASEMVVRGIVYSLPEELDVGRALGFALAEVVVLLFLACNSLWNFFIYNARSQLFRETLRRIVRCEKQR